MSTVGTRVTSPLEGQQRQVTWTSSETHCCPRHGSAFIMLCVSCQGKSYIITIWCNLEHVAKKNVGMCINAVILFLFIGKILGKVLIFLLVPHVCAYVQICKICYWQFTQITKTIQATSSVSIIVTQCIKETLHNTCHMLPCVTREYRRP